MIKKAINFVKKEYALVFFSIIFFYFLIVLVRGNYDIYQVKKIETIEIKEPQADKKDDVVLMMENFSKRLKEGSNIPNEIPGNLFRRLPSTILLASSNKSEVACWQCNRKISIDKTVCPFCGALQKHADTDKDGMPDYWEVRYSFNPEDEMDASEDFDKDGYTNLDEYLGGSDPTNPSVTPVSVKFAYEVIDVYRKPVEILFRGYVEMGDSYTFQINWEKQGVTFFQKIGDTIRGYNIKEFKKIIKEIAQPDGTDVKKDESYLVLQRKEADPIKLVINKIFLENELYAKLKNKEQKGAKPFDVHVGSKFALSIQGKKEEFEVTDITVDQVFYKDSKGNAHFIVCK